MSFSSGLFLTSPPGSFAKFLALREPLITSRHLLVKEQCLPAGFNCLEQLLGIPVYCFVLL
eukprot:jgi/Botrbrau1/17977/Bobra.50_1s0066.1